MPHPKDVVAQELVQPGTFTLVSNPNQPDRSVQDTELVTAAQGRALGSNGETQAVAKRKKPDLTGEKNEELTMASGELFENAAVMIRTPRGKEVADQNLSWKYNGALGGDRGLITRQVASHKVDQFLGLNTVTEEKFGRDANGQVFGMSILADGEGVDGKRGTLAVDYRDPRVQRGLTDLEVSDYITGQIDRTPRNIFIDPATGKVTGIDNDLAFPERSRADIMKSVTRQAKCVAGLPRVMHEETRDKILATNPEEMRKMLKNMPVPPPPDGPQKLSDKAIDGAVTRLKEMQAELRKGPNSSIQVVSAFNDTTYQNALQTQISDYESRPKNKPWNQFSSKDKESVDVGVMSHTPKTSYMGMIATQLKVGEIYGNKPHAYAPKADKVPNYDQIKQRAGVYDKLGPQARKALDTDPSKLDARLDTLASKSPKELRDFDKQAGKLQKGVDSDHSHIEHPTGFDRLKAIGSGGMKQLKAKEQQHADKLQNQLDQLTATLDVSPQRPTVTQPPPQQSPQQKTDANKTEAPTMGQENAPKQKQPQKVNAPDKVKPREIEAPTRAKPREVEAPTRAKPRQVEGPMKKPTFPKMDDLQQWEKGQQQKAKTQATAKVPTVEEALNAEKNSRGKSVKKPKVDSGTTVRQEAPELGEGLKTSRSKRSLSVR